MQSLPHHYTVAASALPEGDVSLNSGGLDPIYSAPPIEFGGQGNRWSPENLLVAAVADCFILSFRAIASVSQLSWTALSCEVAGTLERVDGVTKFTAFEIIARLTVSPETPDEKAQRVLEKAEATCLVANSLSASTHLQASVAKGA